MATGLFRMSAGKFRHSGNCETNRGFTLVELLVVIAIIGVLVGLLLPSVQSARESARRSSCQNNLKQIGLAILSHESARKAFPAGYSYFGSNQACWGWGTFILPYMEQTGLYDTLNPSARKLNVVCGSGVTPQDQAALQTKIAQFRCPADRSPDLRAKSSFGYATAAGSLFYGASFPVGTSNYVGMVGVIQITGTYNAPMKNFDTGGFFCGEDDQTSATPGTGPLGNRIKDITDGMSKTIMVGERMDKGLAAAWVGVGAAYDFGPGGTCATLVRPNFNQNWDVYDLYASDNRGKGPSSAHTNGVQYLFADGSVAFITDVISTTLMQYMANRADGKQGDPAKY